MSELANVNESLALVDVPLGEHGLENFLLLCSFRTREGAAYRMDQPKLHMKEKIIAKPEF